MNNNQILGMDQKTFFVILSIGGGLLIAWASSQISNMPPDFATPYELVLINHRWITFYHFLEIIGAAAAIVGGVKTYQNYKQ